MTETNLEQAHTARWRYWALYAIIGIVMLVYVSRLFSLQIINGNEYVSLADENRRSNINLPTQRGLITDRNGYVLAKNVPSYNVVITPAYLPLDDGAIQGVFRELSSLIDLPVSQGELNEETVRLFTPCETDLGITQIVFIADSLAPYDPVRVKCNVDQTTAMVIQEKSADLPGVGIEVEAVRDYPTGELTAEIIGFLGPVPAAYEKYYTDLGFVAGRDKVGYAGIESWMQEELGGKNGLRTVEVDGAGQIIRDLEVPVNPVPGYNVELTIDTRLQAAAKSAVKTELEGWNAWIGEERMTKAAVIAMNPKTGEILALVSYPTFENNRMARQIPADYYQQLVTDPDKPLFNYAISGEFPPGSVYKMASALGILNEDVVTPGQEIEDMGKITILQKYSVNDIGTPREYVCWDEAGHGTVDYLHGIAWSCDVYWYKVGGGYETEVPVGLGIWRMNEYAAAIGYGEPTGIELPGEASGLLPDPTWKRTTLAENWSTGDTYIATMGQGFVLSTPLQVLVSAATIANNGIHMKPTLIKQVTDNEGNVIVPFTPTVVADITKDKVITVYDENSYATDEKISVEPWVIDLAQEGMRLVTLPGGTADDTFATMEIPTAGKTGTAEFCDDMANKKNLCNPGNWPAHAWYIGYAPYDDPEIAVVAFVYYGGEGASVAAPIVRKVMDAYFELNEMDSATVP
jgi:penicillin-binding protein 2